MAWRRIGDKPLSEPMLPRYSEVYMRHYGEMSKVIQVAISSLRWMVLLPAALKGNTTEHDESKRSDIWLGASLSEATLTGL